jgi:hypothetical protein
LFYALGIEYIEEFSETVLSALQRDIHNLAKGFFNLILNLKGFLA